jgi:hypothetical protein
MYGGQEESSEEEGGQEEGCQEEGGQEEVASRFCAR